MRTAALAASLAGAALLGGAAGFLLAGELGALAPVPGVPEPAPASAANLAREREVAALRARLDEVQAARDAEAAAASRLRRELEALKRDRPAAPTPSAMSGWWYHGVDGSSPTLVDFRADGRMVVGEREDVKWSLEGWRLRLTWPDSGAPDGAWVDECLVAEDGRSYAGHNQTGSVIRGTRKPE